MKIAELQLFSNRRFRIFLNLVDFLSVNGEKTRSEDKKIFNDKFSRVFILKTNSIERTIILVNLKNNMSVLKDVKREKIDVANTSRRVNRRVAFEYKNYHGLFDSWLS
ncbi:hypothetical protein ACP8H2_03485 [Bacillus subtilis]|uniref:hypothetical protein n=1 Tax=Bacillus subtilis TaxID=1423 RepID=UPI000DC1C2E4|nr:hypothetical protein CXF51_04445 [Bacillus subtilis subsp. subtilis]NLS90044.1 hypothetical protein [Bacillus subtilis]